MSEPEAGCRDEKCAFFGKTRLILEPGENTFRICRECAERIAGGVVRLPERPLP